MVALFAALISVGYFIHIPMPLGVPIVIQDMLAFLAGLLLGPLYGGLSVLLFLVLGCIGFPVFSGRSGIQVILGGAAGGFLIGYLLGAIACGLIVWLAFKKSGKKSASYQWTVFFIATLSATVIMFFCGAIQFMNVTDSTLVKTIAATVIPFIPGNIIKLVILVILAKKFYPIVKNYLRG